MTRALDAIVVVDLTSTFWAGLGAALLGDFGADVLRVEPAGEAGGPDAGAGGAPAPGAWNHRDALVHRNKRTLAVDLAVPRGREIAQALALSADVVVTDRPAAFLEAHGLDHGALRARQPRLVYARGTCLGPNGPDAGLPAIDELAAARTGMMGILGQPGTPPVYPGHGQMYSTVMLAFGVATAVFDRARTGEGQVVDVSLLGGNAYGASLDLQAYLAIGGERFLHPVARLDAGNPMSGTVYPTSDGRWVTLTMPDTDRWWPALAEITGLDAADTRFESHDKRCGEHRLALMALLDERFRLHDGAHWRREIDARQLSADVIETFAYPAADALARRSRYVLDLDEPSFGPVSSLGFPIFMTATPARLRQGAAYRGQHTAEILRERLGYGEREIAALEDARVVG